MGCGASTQLGSKEEQERNKKINAMLNKDKKEFTSEIKLLLLGAGESGKSTIAKQMKIIHLDGFSEAERNSFQKIIQNAVQSNMRVLVQAAGSLGIELTHKDVADRFAERSIVNPITDEVKDEIKTLWQDDPGVKEAYEQRAAFQLNDSADYFFNRIEEIAHPDYLPSEDDVLRARVKTTGIIQTLFQVGGTKFRMVDVGGQRSERKKWMHCFQDVTSVIFCVALSAYDQTLYEDASTNRMHEALLLFDQICNNRWFQDTSMIVFFNKRDLFEEKIKRVDLNVCFPEYQGGKEYQAAYNFIEDMFMAKNKNKNKAIYPHATCATDTGNVKVVFNAVKDTILQQALQDTGF